MNHESIKTLEVRALSDLCRFAPDLFVREFIVGRAGGIAVFCERICAQRFMVEGEGSVLDNGKFGLGIGIFFYGLWIFSASARLKSVGAH